MALKQIGRVSLSRAIPSELTIGSVLRLELSIISEFFASPIEGILSSCTWKIEWVYKSNVEIARIISQHVRMDIVKLSIHVPDIPGKCTLRFICIHDFLDTFVLSLRTETLSLRGQELDENPKLHFSSIRELNFSRDYVVHIREEYGATLGSHLWDSSIVLSRYMDTYQPTFLAGSRALELGAGLGLCGIWLSKCTKFKHVMISDKAEQVQFIQANIALNRCETAEILCIDWMKPQGVLDSIEIDLILAADVLYEQESALVFLAMVARLMSSRTKLILAQKVRGEKSKEFFECMIEGCGFLCKLLYEEANVYIWLLEEVQEDLIIRSDIVPIATTVIAV